MAIRSIAEPCGAYEEACRSGSLSLFSAMVMKLRASPPAVVGLTLIPLLGAAGLAIWWAHEDERRNMEQALLYHARSLTVAVDREVETSLAGLKGLATSPDLDSGDLRKFYEQARLARDAHRRRLPVALLDPAARPAPNLPHPLPTSP